jgi:hypothetical protein
VSTSDAPLARCRRLSTVPVLSATDALSRWRTALPERTKTNVLACYSSVLGGIVTEPHLAMVPVDDHGFHRGHAVFDTCNVAHGRAFGLTMHLNRLLGSAKQAKIVADDAGEASSLELRESLRSLVLQTIAATRRRDGVFVRYWLSVGRGDFAISPSKLTSGPTFYCVVHEDSHSASGPRGVAACVVPTPLKPPLLATMKSTNYRARRALASALCWLAPSASKAYAACTSHAYIMPPARRTHTSCRLHVAYAYIRPPRRRCARAATSSSPPAIQQCSSN